METLPRENIYGHTKKLRFILEHLDQFQSLHGRSISLLDFGCGNGTAVSQFLIRDGVSYYGVDCHEPSLTYARNYFQGENAMFLDRVPEDILFDVIVYADVLEHLENPVAVLREHARLLKEDGMIIGSIPNGFGPFENEKRCDRWFGVSAGIRFAAALKAKWTRPEGRNRETIPYNSDSTHIQHFSRKEVCSVLSQVGFEMECFCNGSFLGGPLSERILQGAWVVRLNSRIGDWLPHWAVSTWYFTAKRKLAAFTETIHVRDLRRLTQPQKV